MYWVNNFADASQSFVDIFQMHTSETTSLNANADAANPVHMKQSNFPKQNGKSIIDHSYTLAMFLLAATFEKVMDVWWNRFLM